MRSKSFTKKETDMFICRRLFDIRKIRNIGISAHIDSGKTTSTERILYYTGKIKEIHDVKGKDGIGAKMDYMDLEREKGITITSACTFANWRLHNEDYHLNIIDTPEVERSLRVLDGAIMICCGVGGVQSQTVTVDRQMRRYQVPRLVFVNKLDRYGADAFQVLKQIQKRLPYFRCASLQIPIGGEDHFLGVVDCIERSAYFFDGAKASKMEVREVPEDLQEKAEKTRAELLEELAECDDEFAEIYFQHLESGNERDSISSDKIHQAIRRATIANKFAPMLMGSAYKNKGIQPLLDAVCRYLPNPEEKQNLAYREEDIESLENPVKLVCDPKKSLVAFAFKIQDLPLSGNLTFLRIYQGSLNSRESLFNVSRGKRQSIKRLVRLHASETKEIQQASSGEIVAVSGLDCASGTTFTDGKGEALVLQNMHVPDPVMSYSLKISSREDSSKFSKAVARFQKEDPTFRCHVDEESGETIISGMGELHLDIYVERMQREFNLTIDVGEPKVHFRETFFDKVDFQHTHKRQTGGRGQYAKIGGYLEPLDEEEASLVYAKVSKQKTSSGVSKEDDLETSFCIDFQNRVPGQEIPKNLIPSIEKGFRQAARRGCASGHPLINARFVLTSGAAHDVDSSDLAFRLCAHAAFEQIYETGASQILEPIMKVEVQCPEEFSMSVLSTLTDRRGTIEKTETQCGTTSITCLAPLRLMFGYTGVLRGATQGMGEYTMIFEDHVEMPSKEQEELRENYRSLKKPKTFI